MSALLLAHSSDLHIGDVETTRAFAGDALGPLAFVIDAARAARADAVLLAGDVFENNRVPRTLALAAAQLLAAAGRPVVVLPGNHDPLIEDGVWRLASLTAPPNVFVLAAGRRRKVRLPALDLEVWGNAHADYDDMIPLRSPVRRAQRFQVAMAHGHFEPEPDRRKSPRPAWLIGRSEIAATGADYVALGHWNRATAVAGGPVAAHYSGSPELVRSVNLVTLE
ncbi:MAG: hypothetical protein RL477_1064, partial [Pseudomonadota bacterium]